MTPSTKLSKISPALFIYLSFWSLYFLFIWSQELQMNSLGELTAGSAILWTDWALHFTLSTSMAYRDLLPATSPLLLDAPFYYPFSSNLISALLLRAGVPFTLAFTGPSLFFSLFLVGALYYFFNALFRSAGIAALAATIFLLSGGLGFIYFFKDILASAEPLTTLLLPPRYYTYLKEHNIVVRAVIDTLIFPQRSFTHGFPIALFALTLIHTTLTKFSGVLDRGQLIKLSIAAILLGLLPLIHTHSFLAVFIILCFWSAGYLMFSDNGTLLQRAKPWALIAGVTTIIALPLLEFSFLTTKQPAALCAGCPAGKQQNDPLTGCGSGSLTGACCLYWR